jgi:hypothetical protein
MHTTHTHTNNHKHCPVILIESGVPGFFPRPQDVATSKNTRRHNPEHHSGHLDLRNNLKSQIFSLMSFHSFPPISGKCWYSRRTGDSRYTRFRCPRFYFGIMWSISILSVATVEASAQAH